jgi:hypothetical protein
MSISTEADARLVRRSPSAASDEFGPAYTIESATLRAMRRKASKGLDKLPAKDRRAYADAVEAAVRSAQRASLKRAAGPEHRSPSASGTFYSRGADIHRAIRQQQERALLAYPGAVRRARTPQQWQSLYDQAMAAKRRRLALN